MDVIIPLPAEQVHVYYDEGSGTHQVIGRGERVELHHEHVLIDIKGLTTLSAKDREGLLRVRAELLDVKAARAALRERTREAIAAPPGMDQRIIRLDALLRDLELSANRISSRAARLAELDRPFEARASRDAQSTVRLLAGTDEAETISRLISEAERVERERDALLSEHYPYLARIATHAIAARLLTLAGSIRALASAPASRIQLLGAEAALFRHLRNPRQKPPKHGVIHEHPLMQIVPKRQRGRLARGIADKIAIAARVDYFGRANSEDIEKTWHEIETEAQRLSQQKPRRA